MNQRNLLLALLLVSTVALSMLWPRLPMAGDPAPLDRIPREGIGLKSRDVEISPIEKKWLGGAAGLKRIFSFRDRLWLLAVTDGTNNRQAVHDPTYCFLGEGWKIITDHLELERIAVSAAYVGNAQQAVTDALKYAHDRIQFETAIYEFQVIRHMLADMQTSVDAARLLVYRAAEMATLGLPCSKEVSMAKLFASETLQTVTRNGMQIMGGHSMLPEADMERYFREGMQSTIGGGTSQIQRTIIAKQYLGL